jgi:hypothetical protein
MKLGTSEELQMKQLFMTVQVFYSTQKQVHTHSIFISKGSQKNNLNILIYIFVFLSYSPFFRYSSNTNINTNNNTGKKNLLSEGVLVTPQVFGFLNCIAFHELEHHSFKHGLIICETLQHVFIFHVYYEVSSVQHPSATCATSF